jgi:hypothetical protein
MLRSSTLLAGTFSINFFAFKHKVDLLLYSIVCPVMYKSSSAFTHDLPFNVETRLANMVRKALRRSIKGEKDKGPQVSIAPKAAVAIVPPKKVRYLCLLCLHP